MCRVVTIVAIGLFIAALPTMWMGCKSEDETVPVREEIEKPTVEPKLPIPDGDADSTPPSSEPAANGNGSNPKGADSAARAKAYGELAKEVEKLAES